MLFEEERLLDSGGVLCLGSSQEKRTLKEGIEDNLIELNTTVNYRATGKEPTVFHGVNNTVALEDIKDRDLTVTTRARYNVTVVDNTDCTQVEQHVEGTMVHMYETNPD